MGRKSLGGESNMKNYDSVEIYNKDGFYIVRLCLMDMDKFSQYTQLHINIALNQGKEHIDDLGYKYVPIVYNKRKG